LIHIPSLLLRDTKSIDAPESSDRRSQEILEGSVEKPRDLGRKDQLATQLSYITFWKTSKFRNQLVFNNEKFNAILIAREISEFIPEFYQYIG